jgi:predicted DNA-binding transcriptional regulator AlpA
MRRYTVSDERLVSLGEAAAIFGGVSVKTVRRMMAAGELPAAVKVMS